MLYYPSYLPACTLSAQQDTQLNTITSGMPGDSVQRLGSKRTSTIRAVQLKLFGAQLPVFEHFVRDLHNEGVDWFYGKSIYKTGPTHQKMRIVNGAYSVSFTESMDYVVSFSVEISQ